MWEGVRGRISLGQPGRKVEWVPLCFHRAIIKLRLFLGVYTVPRVTMILLFSPFIPLLHPFVTFPSSLSVSVVLHNTVLLQPTMVTRTHTAAQKWHTCHFYAIYNLWHVFIRLQMFMQVYIFVYIIEGREFLCKDCSHFLNIATKINDILRIFIYYVHCMHFCIFEFFTNR